MKTKFNIETESNSIAAQVGGLIQGCETLGEVYEVLCFETSPFKDWMIYKGGNHVAIHKAAGLARCALIRQA